VPLSCVEDFSVKWSLGKWGRYIRSTCVTLAHQANLSYHAPRFGMSTRLCVLWAWILSSITGCPGSHCGTQVALILGAHPEHPISRCAASGLAREEGGYTDDQAPVDLTSLFLWPAGYFTPWQQMFEEITLIHQCFLVFMKFGCC
jgi:hypothetical protein